MLKKLLGSRNQRLINQFKRRVNAINAKEDALKALSDSELAAKTDGFRARLNDGEKLDKLLEDAFAVVREASVRTLGLRHFDVQLIGGMVLNSGKIAEMRTGEGKTLVATLPAYLNALSGEAVHIITVNDYLASRDAAWMGKIFSFLGMSVGTTLSGQSPEEKQAAYACDIVYGTNNEYGFDYLRDNMAFDKGQRVQRGLGFAVIDEVDSILIDEARTPLIISGPAEGSAELYIQINSIVATLTPQAEEDGAGDFSVDEKDKQVALTEEGHENVEAIYAEKGIIQEGSSLYDSANITVLHHTHASLRAQNLFKKDVDYIVRDNKVVIIDEFTGRMMEGRRWSDGLHQAVEAKEGVQVQPENQTLASITFQNYFRLYDTLSGMTGTADTEAPEFQEIYGLEVVVIPTNVPTQRNDSADKVYRTQQEKFSAILEQISECQQRQQPVLVGTSSIDTSELLSQFLENANIKHQVLNAKQHEREALIVAEAGRPSAVTIATNMAGRGTDIVLGGNLEMELEGVDDDKENKAVTEDWHQRHEQVKAAGGLFVIGTERNESRRVDNQLRGRSGRQGDPGASQFYLSLDDNLMRLFGSDRLAGLMERLGMEEGESIEHPWVNKAIENAQRKVEGRNFDIRKQLLEYDDVANEQRRVIYEERNRLMDVEDVSEDVETMKDEVVDIVVGDFIPANSLEEQWEIEELESELREQFALEVSVKEWLNEDKQIDDFGIGEKIRERFDEHLSGRKEQYGEDVMRQVQKGIMLQTLDQQWKEHLSNMDHLRQGIGLRGYGQKNPKQEYKREAFELFSDMLEDVKLETISLLTRVQVRSQEDIERERAEFEAMQRRMQEQIQAQHPSLGSREEGRASEERPAEGGSSPIIKSDRIGRNEPCPCGSGKKYKHCHGKLA